MGGTLTPKRMEAIAAACREVIKAHEKRADGYQFASLNEQTAVAKLLHTILPDTSKERAA